MRIDIAAKRYAQAAFAVALEQGDPDRWLGDLDALVDLVAQPQAAAVLQSDRVPDAEKDILFKAALPDVDPAVLNLARLLVAKRRIRLAGQVREEFGNLLDAHEGRARATVTTAVPLSDGQAAEIAARLGQITGKTVSVEQMVDPEIVGGLIARIGDTLIDGSTRSRLGALKKSLQGSGGWTPALGESSAAESS
ncbi:MAG: ATP synthase F1 subunit delta [Dehalococcoidia bacterium]|nr:ATP synthase F1 subunit delta [Dehalococcoidia bacterium]